ncbi:hypothetical protein FO440_20090 [Mucilaginibacter corticis]|uniref:Uncharacterized protein n=1 Tax=Mucilaginibacter corticis TaxID=2597670 RepID=A0A556MFW5_9SPHI|nr:hypothetical protein [Mucilaginibacter corticis]TSJ38808.1 hypothetical protein FO440_20090 [Mucilaginibacter corticis]
MAQIKVNISDIKKKDFVDAESALGFGRETKFELAPVNNQWLCNQTKQRYNAAYASPGEKAYYERENSVQQKFVKKIDEQTIVDFLKSIAVVEPKFSSAALNITPQTISHYADTSKFADKAKNNLSAKQIQIVLTEELKPEHIKEAIDSLQHDWWTDDYPYYSIHIILKNNDTVKIETNRQPGYMLPWRINKIESYDLNINKFFVAVMGSYKQSNKNRLEGGYLLSQIWDYCYRTFADNAIIRDNWQKLDPVFYNKLKANFKIKDLRDYTTDNGRQVEGILQPNVLPEKAVIKVWENFDSTRFLKKLILFTDSLKRYFKQSNFVFDYYKQFPATQIIFGWYQERSMKWFTPYAKLNLTNLLKPILVFP